MLDEEQETTGLGLAGELCCCHGGCRRLFLLRTDNVLLYKKQQRDASKDRFSMSTKAMLGEEVHAIPHERVSMLTQGSDFP